MPLAGLEHTETHLPLSPSVGIKGVGYHVPQCFIAIAFYTGGTNRPIAISPPEQDVFL